MRAAAVLAAYALLSGAEDLQKQDPDALDADSIPILMSAVLSLCTDLDNDVRLALVEGARNLAKAAPKVDLVFAAIFTIAIAVTISVFPLVGGVTVECVVSCAGEAFDGPEQSSSPGVCQSIGIFTSTPEGSCCP